MSDLPPVDSDGGLNVPSNLTNKGKSGFVFSVAARQSQNSQASD